MNRIYKVIIVVISFIISFNATAQHPPVQFSFTGGRDAGGKAYIAIKATISDSLQLFSTKKKKADDAFISSVEFDSSTKKFVADSLQEYGTIKSIADTTNGGSQMNFFTDTVLWHQPLNISANDSATIKGTITWLGKQGNNFPQGEESFSVKIKAADAANAVAETTDKSL